MKSVFAKSALAASLFIVMTSVLLSAESAHDTVFAPEISWDRDLAMQAARSRDTNSEAEKLFQLAINAKSQAALRGVSEFMSLPGWPNPAREAVIYELVRKLRNLPAQSVDPALMEFLLTFQNRVLVAHEESGAIAVPLFPIRATAQGLFNQWTQEQMVQDAAHYLAQDPQSLVEIYANSVDPNIRTGIETAIEGADATTLLNLLEITLPLIEQYPGLTGLAGTLALATDDTKALAEVFIHGEGSSLVELSRRASGKYREIQLGRLLADTVRRSPSSTAAMLIAEWSPLSVTSEEAGSALTSMLDDPELGSTAALALASRNARTAKSATKTTAAKNLPRPAAAEDGSIVQWTQADGVLGLGYPVPIPVDTPLPFDGFRSYNGLHTRHQDLMATTSIVHGEVVGATHNGRDIWAYRVGDADLVTPDGRPEPATLTNGGIHAREWQTPEIVTGIMELFAEKQGDHHFYDFLLENVNMVLLPVQNVDGFLQTQRYPTQNWLHTDPFDPQNDPQPSPRDGRMRRKNMPGVDEVLSTRDDHLLGIDLNRNNPPFWSNNQNRSSPDSRSLVYQGEMPRSEPEAQALVAAAELGPVSQLRAFTDVHSFSKYFYYQRTQNTRLNSNTVDLIYSMRRYMLDLPNGTTYQFSASSSSDVNQGFGMTNEWFTTELQIPSFGIEVEPSGGQPGSSSGCGADYGGLARNCHDGFILPESQIRRVREELAQSFAAAFYQQAGPPSIAAVRFVDSATDAVVFEAEWDPVTADERKLYVNQVQPLELDRDYMFWIAYDRPMRWRENNEVARLPGQPPQSLDFYAGGFVGDIELTSEQGPAQWLNTEGEAPHGYYRYEDDSLAAGFRFPDSQTNRGLISGNTLVTLHNETTNMTNQALDTDPSTAVSLSEGGWAGYEADDGEEHDRGGTDKTIQFLVSPDVQPDPFVIEPGISAAWFDPSHDGEGFLIEILPDNRAVMYWFTFDENGEQAWYLASGEIIGNRLVFPELVQTSGGVFGPDFDPDTVVRTVVGSATFLYESCSSGTMVYELPGRKGRFELQRLSRVMGANCGKYLGPPERPEEIQSGSWYNVDQDGHGFVIEVLSDGQVLIYWFTYDLEGNQAWFLGVGEIEQEELVISEVFQTRGPTFGTDYNPEDLELIPWGELRFALSCDSGSVSYDGTPAGFGAATIDLIRLSTLAGLGCL